MVRIRLARSGAKKQPFYRIVVTAKRSRRDGGFADRIGFMNPVAVGGEIPLRIDTERYDYWIAQGAKPSKRVQHLAKFYAKHGEGESAKRSAPPESKAPDKASQPTPAPEAVSQVASEVAADVANADDGASDTGDATAATEDATSDQNSDEKSE